MLLSAIILRAVTSLARKIATTIREPAPNPPGAMRERRAISRMSRSGTQFQSLMPKPHSLFRVSSTLPARIMEGTVLPEGAKMPNVYQQSFSLLEALWRPLVQHGIIEKVSAPVLASWIIQHIGASFPSSASEEPATRHAYLAYHSWNEYRAGDFDEYFWGAGAAGEKTVASDVQGKKTPGLAQLLPPALFDELCRMLSTTRDARIPERPYASFNGQTEGLWFYGLHQFDHVSSADELPKLQDQFCQRGIGPGGQLVLRSRPFGGLALDARDLDYYRDDFDTKALIKEQTTADNLDDKRMTFLMLFMRGKKNSKLNETFLWNQQYKNNRLDTLLDARRLGSESSTEDDMRTSVRQALDLAVCLSFAAAREVEKQLGATIAREELLSALLGAEVRGTSAAPGTGKPLLDVSERTQLMNACTWPDSALGIAAAATCAIVRLLLGASPSAFDALFDHFDYLEQGGVSAMLDFKNGYLREVAAWGDVLDMRDADNERFSYRDLYVAPEFEQRPGADARPSSSSDPRAANPACIVARMPGRARLLIQAGSGMGKTTYVKGLAAGIARMRISGDGTLFNTLTHHEAAVPLMNCTPVLIAQPEAALAGKGFEALESTRPELSSDEFASLLYRQLPDALKAPFRTVSNGDKQAALELFRSLLKAPDSLVIVDSIDEVPLAVRNRYIDCLADLAEDPHYNIQRLIVTSRPLEDASELKLEHALSDNIVRLLPFDQDRQRDLFERLRQNHPEDDAQAIAFEDIAETPGFDSLLGNPLLLTALVRSLLRNPHATAFNVLDTLVELLPKLPEQDVYDDLVLAHIAFDMTANAGGDSIDELTFRKRYQTYRGVARSEATLGAGGDEPSREDIIDRMVTRRGILTMRNGNVSFEHTIVRALFACRHVLNALTSGVSERLSQEQYDRAYNLYSALLDVCIDPERGDAAAELAILLLLSARRPYATRFYEDLQADIYRELCGLTLNAFGENQYHHDVAVKLIQASHSFDFGLPCRRNEQIRVWESRLVAFADYYAADEASIVDHERTDETSANKRAEER